MKKNVYKPKVCLEYSYNDFLLATKQFMIDKGMHHVTGLTESPMLMGKVTEEQMRAVVDHAIKKGVFYGNDNAGYRIDPILRGFIEKYVTSANIVSVDKPSYKNARLISFGRSGDVFVCLITDSRSDKAVCLADDDVHKLYTYVKDELEKKDTDKNFNLKKANKTLTFAEGSDKFEFKAENRLFLCTTSNGTGKSLEKEVLIHVQKDEYEYVTVRPELKVEGRRHVSELEKDVCNYIINNCPADNDDGPADDGPDGNGGGTDGIGASGAEGTSALTGSAAGVGGASIEDPEDFSMYSFTKLTSAASFPKSTGELLKAMFGSLKASFNKKTIIKNAIIYAVTMLILALWNLYANCYLNDTFKLRTEHSVFNGLTPYLLFGRLADKSKGLSVFFNENRVKPNTIFLVSGVYILIVVAIRGLIADIASGRIGKVFASFFSFGKKKKAYMEASLYDAGFFFFAGLLISAILNVILYNPATSFVLAVMLIVSCMKGDEGALAGTCMVFSCASRYKKVNEGRKKMPMYSHIQLSILNVGYGMLINTVINIIVWYAFDFKPVVRIVLALILVIFAIVKLVMTGKNGKNAVKIVLYLLFTVGTSLMVAASYYGVLLADDGGITESGDFWGLLHNEGFPYILGISLAAAAVVVLTAAFLPVAISGAAVAIGAGAAALGAGALAAQGDNYKVAANLLLGGKSEFADDAEAAFKATLIDTAIGFIPVVGNVVGILEGSRDVGYGLADLALGNTSEAIGELSWGALGIGCSICGLDEAGKINGIKDVGAKIGENIDNFSGDIGKAIDLAQAGVNGNTDDFIKSVKNITGIEKAADLTDIKKVGKALDNINSFHSDVGSALDLADNGIKWAVESANNGDQGPVDINLTPSSGQGGGHTRTVSSGAGYSSAGQGGGHTRTAGAATSTDAITDDKLILDGHSVGGNVDTGTSTHGHAGHGHFGEETIADATDAPTDDKLILDGHSKGGNKTTDGHKHGHVGHGKF